MAAIVVAPNGHTSFYTRNDDGSIRERDPDGAIRNITPAGEARLGTPLAAVALSGSGDHFQEIHVFFLATDNTLNEWVWTAPTDWAGGPAGVAARQFAVALDSRILYAVQTAGSTLRVGFISQDGKLREAAKPVGGAWALELVPPP
ncbi:hypothetical protein BD779DRAFT_1667887 [Infundibulicybe gibba]|nr:hypothetical protein BD779DRAFT_1667887 [Infundibulicybe gibba]